MKINSIEENIPFKIYINLLPNGIEESYSSKIYKFSLVISLKLLENGGNYRTYLNFDELLNIIKEMNSNIFNYLSKNSSSLFNLEIVFENGKVETFIPKFDEKQIKEIKDIGSFFWEIITKDPNEKDPGKYDFSNIENQIKEDFEFRNLYENIEDYIVDIKDLKNNNFMYSNDTEIPIDEFQYKFKWFTSQEFDKISMGDNNKYHNQFKAFINNGSLLENKLQSISKGATYMESYLKNKAADTNKESLSNTAFFKVKNIMEKLSEFVIYPNLKRRLGLILDFGIEGNLLQEQNRQPKAIDLKIRDFNDEIFGKSGLLTEIVDWKNTAKLKHWILDNKELIYFVSTNDRYEYGLQKFFQRMKDETDGSTRREKLYIILNREIVSMHLNQDQVTKQFLSVLETNNESSSEMIKQICEKTPTAKMISGVSLYFKNRAEEFENTKKLKNNKKLLDNKEGGNNVYEESVTIGQRIGVIKNNINSINSLCHRKGKYSLRNMDIEFTVGDDEGMITESSSLARNDSSEGTPFNYVTNNKMFCWDGTNLSLPSIFKVNEEEKKNSQDRKGFINGAIQILDKDIKIQFESIDKSNTKLRFDRDYKFCATNVYLNGWSTPFNSNGSFQLSVSDLLQKLEFEDFITEKTTFKRIEFPPPPEIILETPLTDKSKEREPSVIKGKEGEHLYNMVIRDPGNDVCIRHLVPPKSSIQFCMWHGMFDNITPEESWDYVLREKKDLKEFYKDEQNFAVPYLPDSLVKKFFIRCITKDFENEFNSQLSEGFDFAGEWPFIYNWKIILKKYRNRRVSIEAKTHSIYLYLKKGEEINFEIFSANGMNSPSEKINLTMVFAIQKPLNVSILNDNFIARREVKNPNILILDNILEDLSTLENNKISKIDIFAKWEEYVDDALSGNDPTVPIKKYTNEDFKDFDGYTLELSIDLEQLNSEKRQSLNSLRIVQKDSRYRVKHFIIRTTSKFINYFTPIVADSDEEFERKFNKKFGLFNKSSTTLIKKTIAIKNNEVPEIPKIECVIPMFQWIESEVDTETIKRSRKCNMLRIKINQPFAKNGKGQMLGFILNECLYGRDYTTKDGNAIMEATLKLPNFGISESQKEKEYFNYLGFKAIYFKDLLYFKNRECLGIEPKFNKSEKKWYLDILIDVRDEYGAQMYFPFINLTVVNLHPISEIYDTPTLKKDCRISETTNLGYFQISHSRSATVRLKKMRDTIEATVKMEEISQSKKYYNDKGNVEIATEIWLAFESSMDRRLWFTMKSKYSQQTKNWHKINVFDNAEHTLNLVFVESNLFVHDFYRLVIYEVEIFPDQIEKNTTNYDVQNDPNKRLVYADTFVLQK